METGDVQLLRKLAAISGKEYGLAKALLEAGVTSRDALELMLQRVVCDRLRVAKGRLFLAARVSRDSVAETQKLVREQGPDPGKQAETLRAVEAKYEQELRTSISLAYYAMYHAARGLVLMVERDDETDHGKVTKRAAAILQEEAGSPSFTELPWDRCFERARSLRNEVDYSPYPDVGNPIWDFLGLPLSMAKNENLMLAIETIAACEKVLLKRGVEV